MWRLDPSKSSGLLAALRPHWRQPGVAWVGEGWRDLVQECHDSVSAVFPEYELLAVKQKYGVLEFQAFPRPWTKAKKAWTDSEYAALMEIAGSFRTRSESACEWCGEPARLREKRTFLLTLCDPCDDRFEDPPRSRKG